MRICTVDLETFWSQTHSLSKMLPMTYCTHPETEIISCAFKFGDNTTSCVFGETSVKAFVSIVDWSDVFLIAHNMMDEVRAAFATQNERGAWHQFTAEEAWPVYHEAFIADRYHDCIFESDYHERYSREVA